MISLPRAPSGRIRAPQFPPTGTARPKLIVAAKLTFWSRVGFLPTRARSGLSEFRLNIAGCFRVTIRDNQEFRMFQFLANCSRRRFRSEGNISSKGG